MYKNEHQILVFYLVVVVSFHCMYFLLISRQKDGSHRENIRQQALLGKVTKAPCLHSVTLQLHKPPLNKDVPQRALYSFTRQRIKTELGHVSTSNEQESKRTYPEMHQQIGEGDI